jgi:LacI family transcriptional regulator
MKDIANELEISVVTVSRALRDHPDVGKETKRRILERAKALNYRPNFAARALITGRSYTMALVVPGLLRPFFAEFARSLTGVIRKQGYGLLISSTEENPELEIEEVDLLLSRGVDVLLLASCQTSHNILDNVEKSNLPHILLDRRLDGKPTHFVGTDDELAGFIATEHLIKSGYRRIAHIGGRRISTAIRRQEGYRRALAQYRMDAPAEYITQRQSLDDMGDKNGYIAMRQLLKLSSPPDAVFCYNDQGAAGAMKAILEVGFRIPEDVGIVGCGNLHFAEYFSVPLTSVDQDVAAIGRHAGKLALSIADSKAQWKPRIIEVKPKLVIRGSSQRKTR